MNFGGISLCYYNNMTKVKKITQHTDGKSIFSKICSQSLLALFVSRKHTQQTSKAKFTTEHINDCGRPTDTQLKCFIYAASCSLPKKLESTKGL